MEEIIKKYHSAILELGDHLYHEAIKMLPQQFDWDDNAFIWNGYFVKEGEKVLNKMTYELNSIELKALARQLQNIGEVEFDKLKLRIEGGIANSGID